MLVENRLFVLIICKELLPYGQTQYVTSLPDGTSSIICSWHIDCYQLRGKISLRFSSHLENLEKMLPWHYIHSDVTFLINFREHFYNLLDDTSATGDPHFMITSHLNGEHFCFDLQGEANDKWNMITDKEHGKRWFTRRMVR